MRMPATLCLGLLLAPLAAADEPAWTRDQRQAHRDAVFTGRVESTARLHEAGPVVDVFFVRPADSTRTSRASAYVELAPGDVGLFFAQATLDPVRGEEALFVDLASDAAAGVPPSPGIGLRLVTEDWRVWSKVFSELPTAGYEIGSPALAGCGART